MKAFFDSSALAKRYVEEEGSDRVERLCRQASQMAVSVICVPEIISALNRRQREKALTPVQYRQAKARLLAEVAAATVVNLVPAVIAEAITVLERHPVRALDALQLACAIQWEAEAFVSADGRQLAAASRCGLRARRV